MVLHWNAHPMKALAPLAYVLEGVARTKKSSHTAAHCSGAEIELTNGGNISGVTTRDFLCLLQRAGITP